MWTSLNLEVAMIANFILGATRKEFEAPPADRKAALKEEDRRPFAPR